MKPKPGTNAVGAMRQVARGAAKLMAADDGPRIAALAFDGWDTHANEGGPVGRLAQLLSGLDGALAEFESGLGERWRDTVVVVATEFGRTARINGTEGTDHGTGTIALLAGGAVKGGRVIADWPGLKPASLYRGPRSRADHRSARGDQGRAARSSRPRRARAGGSGVSRQRCGEADAGAGGVIAFVASTKGKIRRPGDRAGTHTPCRLVEAIRRMPFSATAVMHESRLKAGTTAAECMVDLLLRDRVDLRDLLRAQRPADRLDVLLDLLDAGGAGDHA